MKMNKEKFPSLFVNIKVEYHYLISMIFSFEIDNILRNPL